MDGKCAAQGRISERVGAASAGFGQDGFGLHCGDGVVVKAGEDGSRDDLGFAGGEFLRIEAEGDPEFVF